MRVPQLRLAALALTSAIALSGCAYGMYDDGYGYGGYGPYSGSGVSIGIGYGSGYGGYGYGSGYGGYGYGYPYGGYYGGYDPFGWYGDYYYPGSGIYVYDRYRHRHQWTDEQRRYWSDRRDRWQHRSGTTTTGTGENWGGFDGSRWSGHRDGSTTGSTTTSNWRGSETWRNRSSEATSSGTTTRRSDGDRGEHRHGRHQD